MKTDQYRWMMKHSPDAKACVQAFNDGRLFEHAKSLIDLVKIGYTREELYSFLKCMYSAAGQHRTISSNEDNLWSIILIEAVKLKIIKVCKKLKEIGFINEQILFIVVEK